MLQTLEAAGAACARGARARQARRRLPPPTRRTLTPDRVRQALSKAFRPQAAAIQVGGETLHGFAGCGIPTQAEDFGKMWGGGGKGLITKNIALQNISDGICLLECSNLQQMLQFTAQSGSIGRT